MPEVPVVPPGFADDSQRGQVLDPSLAMLNQESSVLEPPPATRRVARQLTKTKLCKHHMRGFCRYAGRCGYAHGAPELMPKPNLIKTQLCANFLSGLCTVVDCTYAHGLTDLRRSKGLNNQQTPYSSVTEGELDAIFRSRTLDMLPSPMALMGQPGSQYDGDDSDDQFTLRLNAHKSRTLDTLPGFSSARPPLVMGDFAQPPALTRSQDQDLVDGKQMALRGLLDRAGVMSEASRSSDQLPEFSSGHAALPNPTQGGSSQNLPVFEEDWEPSNATFNASSAWGNQPSISPAQEAIFRNGSKSLDFLPTFQLQPRCPAPPIRTLPDPLPPPSQEFAGGSASLANQMHQLNRAQDHEAIHGNAMAIHGLLERAAVTRGASSTCDNLPAMPLPHEGALWSVSRSLDSLPVFQPQRRSMAPPMRSVPEAPHSSPDIRELLELLPSAPSPSAGTVPPQPTPGDPTRALWEGDMTSSQLSDEECVQALHLVMSQLEQQQLGPATSASPQATVHQAMAMVARQAIDQLQVLQRATQQMDSLPTQPVRQQAGGQQVMPPQPHTQGQQSSGNAQQTQAQSLRQIQVLQQTMAAQQMSNPTWSAQQAQGGSRRRQL